MINDRILKLIMAFAEGNKRRFSQITSLSPSVVENLVGSRQGKPSFEVLEKIVLAFANLNTDWLITGRGEMFLTNTLAEKNSQANGKDDEKKLSLGLSPDEEKYTPNYILAPKNGKVNGKDDGKDDEKNAQVNAQVDNKNAHLSKIPVYNIPVSVTALELNPNEVSGYVDMAVFAGCECIIPALGMSMESIIHNGDFIGIKSITNLSEQWDFLETGRIYLIITREKNMIKFINESSDNQYIVCSSPNYAPFKINKSDILQIFRIIAIARGI